MNHNSDDGKIALLNLMKKHNEFSFLFVSCYQRKIISIYFQVDLLGHSIYNVIHPDDHEIFQQQLIPKGECSFWKSKFSLFFHCMDIMKVHDANIYIYRLKKNTKMFF